jgi:hypothetical protein
MTPPLKDMKKAFLSFAFMILFSSMIAAYSLDISFPNTNEFSSTDPITFKVTIYDDAKNQVDGQVAIEIQDSEKRITKTTVNSKELSSVKLVKDASSGQGIIKATYENTNTIEFFEIGREEKATFELEGTNLIVTNIGNTPYSRTISITIGETTGTQTPNLEIGQKISYRLIAPEGVYNIKVTDGDTSLIRGGISLTGTGNVIGAIDNSPATRSGITGGVSPEEGSTAILSYIKDNKFIYVFVAVIFGAMILVAIERNYKRKIGK